MRDATPVLTLLVLSGCGLLFLALQWVSLRAPVRQQRLSAIAVAEEARRLPPARFHTQVFWLLKHRLARVQGLSGLLGLSGLIGLAEGVAARRCDRFAGLRLCLWTLSVLSAALLPGCVGALLLWPSPWSDFMVGGVGAVWSAATCFGLSRGRPYVP